jgi:hypothetical protein
MILSSARHVRHVRHVRHIRHRGVTRPPARRNTQRASGRSRCRARTDPADRGERPPELGCRATSNGHNAPVHLGPSLRGCRFERTQRNWRLLWWFSHQSATWRATLAGSVSATPVGAAGCETRSSIRQLATKTGSRTAFRPRMSRKRAELGCLACR